MGAAGKPRGVLECDCAYAAKAHMLRDLEHNFAVAHMRGERVADCRKLVALKVDVDDRPDNLFYFSFHIIKLRYAVIASIPPVISLTSLVMPA